jgi:hypothetical protein
MPVALLVEVWETTFSSDDPEMDEGGDVIPHGRLLSSIIIGILHVDENG